MNVSLTLLLGRIFKLILFISFVFVAVPQLSLAVVRGGYSLVAVRGFLMAMASHGDGFYCCGAWVQGHASSVVVVQGLSCLMACGIFQE